MISLYLLESIYIFNVVSFLEFKLAPIQLAMGANKAEKPSHNLPNGI